MGRGMTKPTIIKHPNSTAISRRTAISLLDELIELHPDHAARKIESIRRKREAVENISKTTTDCGTMPVGAVSAPKTIE